MHVEPHLSVTHGILPDGKANCDIKAKHPDPKWKACATKTPQQRPPPYNGQNVCFPNRYNEVTVFHSPRTLCWVVVSFFASCKWWHRTDTPAPGLWPDTRPLQCRWSQRGGEFHPRKDWRVLRRSCDSKSLSNTVLGLWIEKSDYGTTLRN